MILGGKDGCGCEFYFVSLVGVPLVLYGCHLHRALAARLVLCAEHARARWAFNFGCFGGGQREYFILCHLLKCFILCKGFLLPEENTLKGLHLNWLLKGGVIKLWIDHSGVLTNIIPVLCLPLLFFWCWVSSVYSPWPSSNYENNHYFHALVLRTSVPWTLLNKACETGQLLVALRASPWL